MASPIFSKYFRNRVLLSGKVFDSPASQLFRLERATDRLLPLLHPASRVMFERGSGGLRAHTLQLEDEGAAGRSSIISRGLGMNRKLGINGRAHAELGLRTPLNRLNRLITAFRK